MRAENAELKAERSAMKDTIARLERAVDGMKTGSRRADDFMAAQCKMMEVFLTAMSAVTRKDDNAVAECVKEMSALIKSCQSRLEQGSEDGDHMDVDQGPLRAPRPAPRPHSPDDSATPNSDRGRNKRQRTGESGSKPRAADRESTPKPSADAARHSRGRSQPRSKSRPASGRSDAAAHSSAAVQGAAGVSPSANQE